MRFSFTFPRNWCKYWSLTETGYRKVARLRARPSSRHCFRAMKCTPQSRLILTKALPLPECRTRDHRAVERLFRRKSHSRGSSVQVCSLRARRWPVYQGLQLKTQLNNITKQNNRTTRSCDYLPGTCSNTRNMRSSVRKANEASLRPARQVLLCCVSIRGFFWEMLSFSDSRDRLIPVIGGCIVNVRRIGSVVEARCLRSVQDDATMTAMAMMTRPATRGRRPLVSECGGDDALGTSNGRRGWKQMISRQNDASSLFYPRGWMNHSSA